jgi:hypothetical protein
VANDQTAIFIQLGWLQIGAYGQLAVIVVALIVAAYLAGKALKAW